MKNKSLLEQFMLNHPLLSSNIISFILSFAGMISLTTMNPLTCLIFSSGVVVGNIISDKFMQK